MEESDNNNLKKVKVTIEKSEHSSLSCIASHQLMRAKKIPAPEQFKFILPSMLFSIITIECSANVYGSQILGNKWKYFEGSTSLIGKIILISECLNILVDFSKEPWQTIQQMINFRNKLVHAKPDKSSEEYDYPNNIDENNMLEKISADMTYLGNPNNKKQSIFANTSIETAEKYIKIADDLERSWFSQAIDLGYNVQPHYKKEVIDIE